MAIRFSATRRRPRSSAIRCGIPRVINLLCEHCLVSAFVDQKKMVALEIVDSVARDFDLADGTAGAMMPARARPRRQV